MNSLLIELQFLPPISYFMLVAGHDKIILERHEHYLKQSYRNRCYVKTSQGIEMLVVPVTSKHGKPKVTDVRIDYDQKWVNQHLRTLQTAYGKAPFFEFYMHDLTGILSKRFTYLYDLNFRLLSLCLSWLSMTPLVTESSTYEKKPFSALIDRRNDITPKKNVIAATRGNNLPTYTQVFGSKFAGDLSIIDLIFCKGPEARSILQSPPTFE